MCSELTLNSSCTLMVIKREKVLEILKVHVSTNANSVYDPIYKLLKQLLALGTKLVPSQALATDSFSQLIKCIVRTGYEFMPPENYWTHK